MRSPQILMMAFDRGRSCKERGMFLTALEDVPHAPVGVTANVQRPPTGSIQTFIAHLRPQAHDAQARAEALFRVDFLPHDLLKELCDILAMLPTPLDQAHRSPLALPPMSCRHVLGDRRVPVPVMAARMDGHALPVMRHFNGAGRCRNDPQKRHDSRY